MENITMNKILSIADNPKFCQLNERIIHKHTNVPGENLMVLDLMKDCFGFRRGDEIICNLRFNPKDIKPDTLVIAEFEDGHCLTINANIENVLGVVVAFTREVVQG
jgi:hypothetical protein